MKKVVIDIDQVVGVDEPIAACIGYFDGLHIGHQELISQTLKHAKIRKIKSAMITFHPDPWVVIKNIDRIQHLTTIQDRIELVEKSGIDYWIVINFTQEVAAYPAESFIENVLCKLPIQVLVYGFDFRFGFRGLGDSTLLHQKGSLCFENVEVAPITTADKQKISTTRISELVVQGEVLQASSLLGRLYSISGIVISGRKKGREIGFPTANLDYPLEYTLPKRGVYIGTAKTNLGTYKAMINIGFNPTFNSRSEISVEAYLLDFNDDLYGQRISISFIQRIRDEQKFACVQELIEQMNHDYSVTREYFQENAHYKRLFSENE